MSAYRTSRHGDQYEPVTDFKGAGSPMGTEAEREQRYTRLKKRSVGLALMGVIGVIAYVVLGLVVNLVLPYSARGLGYVLAAVMVVCLAGGIVSLIAALIVRLVAALKR